MSAGGHRRAPRGGITVFRAPKPSRADSTRGQKPSLPMPQANAPKRGELDSNDGDVGTPKKVSLRKVDGEFEGGAASEPTVTADAPLRSPYSVMKKKKRKGGDPEKAKQAAVYAAVNAAHAADAAAKVNALSVELRVANKEKETELDLAEHTRVQLETLLSERARTSVRIATLERERDAHEELLALQNQALDEAECTIEDLKRLLRERDARASQTQNGETEKQNSPAPASPSGDDGKERAKNTGAVEAPEEGAEGHQGSRERWE